MIKSGKTIGEKTSLGNNSQLVFSEQVRYKYAPNKGLYEK